MNTILKDNTLYKWEGTLIKLHPGSLSPANLISTILHDGDVFLVLKSFPFPITNDWRTATAYQVLCNGKIGYIELWDNDLPNLYSSVHAIKLTKKNQ